MLKNISKMKLVKIINLPFHTQTNGDLVFIEGMTDNAPFSIKRVFNVRAKKESIRGKHSHINCSQLLICTNGSVEVFCDNNSETATYVLDKPNQGLLIFPGVWSEQKYLEEDTVLTVLCDQKYEEEDYIRDYEKFSKYIISK